MSDRRHTFQKFSGELQQLKAEVLRMGQLAREQLDRSMGAVVRQEPETAAHVIQRNAELHELKRQIEGEVIRLLALRGPVAMDLRRVIAALKIGIFLERIGEFANNIARRGIVDVDLSPPGESVWSLFGDYVKNLLAREPGDNAALDSQLEPLEQIGGLVSKRLAELMQAYADDDHASAEAIWRTDGEVDRLYLRCFGSIMGVISADRHVNEVCVARLFIVKNIERIGDYVSAIAEIVCYEIAGDLEPAAIQADHRPEEPSGLFPQEQA